MPEKRRRVGKMAKVEPTLDLMDDRVPEDTADKPEIASTLMDQKAPEDRGVCSNQSDSIGLPRAGSAEVPDFVCLYYTLVLDGAVPRGYLHEFLSLEGHVRTAAERADRRNSSITNFSAAGWLHLQKSSQQKSERSERDAFDQLVLASTLKPRKFRSKCQEHAFQGPSARQDAESAERTKWLNVLADILIATPTPMGALLRADPAARKILGAGRRASTIRARVRTIRKFLVWLGAEHTLPYPDNYLRLIEYMQVRHSEPCPRGSLKLVHVAFVFMEELAGVRERFTDVPLYASARKELMASSPPTSESKQAHRYPIIVLAALEEFFADSCQPVYLRIFAWWLMLQSWGTLRFSDHRGLEPINLRIEGGSLLAKLTRSKTLGSDKPVSSRLVVVDREAYVRNSSWLADGLHLLRLQAPFERDYLLPAPSDNFAGVRMRELRYDTAFGIQSRIISQLCYRGQKLFNFVFPHYWSPHSGRNFLPTAAASLGFTAPDRNLLGGWSARGSEQYNRLAKYKIAQIQREVVKCIWNKDSQDPLSESDTLREFAEFLRTNLVSETQIARSIHILSSRQYTETERAQQDDLPPAGVLLEEELEVDDCFMDLTPEEIINEKRQAWNKEKTKKLGSDPKKYRAELRTSLQPGFYVSISPKKRIRTVHRLGQCYLIPGLDYVRYEYLGASMPDPAMFDLTCKWCAKGVGFDASSGTDTSSSSEDPLE